jgi:hypothetical protein
MKPDRPTPTRRSPLQAALAAAAALLSRRRRAAAAPPKPRKRIRWIGHG